MVDTGWTGIDERPGDISQPFAVWFEGQIVRFESDRIAASRVLDQYQEHGAPVDRKTVYNQNRRKDEF